MLKYSCLCILCGCLKINCCKFRSIYLKYFLFFSLHSSMAFFYKFICFWSCVSVYFITFFSLCYILLHEYFVLFLFCGMMSTSGKKMYMKARKKTNNSINSCGDSSVQQQYAIQKKFKLKFFINALNKKR